MRLIAVLFLILPLLSTAQNKQAFALFTSEGKPAKYQKILQQAAESDVVFFGELHNNPIAHWLQLELTQDLHREKEGKILLGAEMFETDNQILIDEYFSDQITQKSFEEEARLWNNYATDYKPLLEFAKAQGIPFIASNIPRRYANLVYRQGLEALEGLSETGRSFLPPLPIEVDLDLPSYKEMLDMMGGHGGPQSANFPKSQAAKDATMGYFISRNLQEGHTFIHYNGSFHSKNKEGIIWYLNRYAPGTSVFTIQTVEQESIDELEEAYLGVADFIVVIPANMTKTY